MLINGREVEIKPNANLWGADLGGANLWGADLGGADLRGTSLENTKLPAYQICPETGAFRAWKKLQHSIAELGIPGDAARTASMVGRKCRASKVKVLRLIPFRDSDASMVEDYARHDGTTYRVGEYTHPDKYDPDPRVDCTNGIHFFVTRAEAEAY